MAQAVRKNDFTQGTMLGNIAKMALPLTTALLVNVLYSVVDRVYIGHIPDVGADSLTGIGIASPVILLISAFQALCSTGGAPLCSIARGKGDNATAELYLGNSYSLLLGMGFVLMVLGELFAEPLLRMIGASETVLGYAMSYLRIYLIGTVFALTGKDRDEQAARDNRFPVYRGDKVLYAAKLEAASASCGITQESLVASFCLIRQDWKTGET